MIDDQLAAFPAHERFMHALLGLLSTCSGLTEALEQQRPDGECCADGPFIDAALGVVSLTRTLRALLGAPGDSDMRAQDPPSEPGPHALESEGLLR